MWMGEARIVVKRVRHSASRRASWDHIMPVQTRLTVFGSLAVFLSGGGLGDKMKRQKKPRE